jgi:hypothetical protein
MKKKIIVAFFFIFLIFGNQCESKAPQFALQTSLDSLYNKAVRDAMIIDDNEVYTGLTVINKNNKNLIWVGDDLYERILVGSLTKEKNINYKQGDTNFTGNHEIWVTIVPELKNWFKKRSYDSASVQLRIEQLLGLPYNPEYNRIVEMWVRPCDLLRPTFNNEIENVSVEMYFPEYTDSTYIRWFNDYIINAYFSSPKCNKYPWTRLGYTYDWGNPDSEIGISEFIIKRNSKVIIKSISTITDYVR